jgi:hypothetical protein
MRKSIVLSVVTALLLLSGTSTISSSTQDTSDDQTPTFYRLTPGVYVNPWPRFTVRYPKDWVEKRPQVNESFRAAAPGPVPFPAVGVAVGPADFPYPVTLDNWADSQVRAFRAFARDVQVVRDKPIQLRDGTPAREVELHFVANGTPVTLLSVGTRKGDVFINVSADPGRGEVTEDLKAILRSLEFQPEKDKPVKIPPDVQELLEKWDSDYVSHDLAKVMGHFSDKYLGSGTRKGEVERFIRQSIGSTTSKRTVTTYFVPEGNRTYLAGFTVFNWGTVQFAVTIIQENGEWKFYGNQRDPAPWP